MEFVFIISFVVGINVLFMTLATSWVREDLRKQGVEAGEVKANWWRGGRSQIWVNFKGFVRGTGALVSGHALVVVLPRRLEFVWDRDFDRTAALRERLAGTSELPDTSEMDLEQRITFETNQRLERLMGDREAFLQNDLDGDGVVDSEEWAKVRERVAAEVRAELEAGGPTAPASIAPPAVHVEPIEVPPFEASPVPESHIVAEDDVEGDGSW